VLAARVHDYFSPEEFTVLTEAQGDGASFARLKVDHMFFTGSPQVGALVAAAAAENLVPVTLELGGKNPVVLDASADLAQAAERIADSRMINGGQVCLCPDYVFVPADRLDEFTTMVVDRWRSRNPQIIANKDFVSLVNDKNFDRVVGLIDDAVARGARKHEAAPDGEVLPDRATRKIAPTLLTGVRGDMRISQEEVFGPVLSVYPYTNLRQVTDHINEHEHPLTMYWFGDQNSRFEQLAAETRTGSISANDFAVIFNNKNLPFGGIGQSGSGQYHGPFGFETFSHQRAVAFSRAPFSGAAVAVGPYTKLESRLIKFQMRAMHRAVRNVTRRSASEGGSSEGRA
jgi:coniferyl-aldehyde dehydrogenase